MTAGNPSGIAETATATENRSISTISYPRSRPRTNTITAMPTPPNPRMVPSLDIRLCRGVSSRSVLRTSCAIRPDLRLHAGLDDDGPAAAARDAGGHPDHVVPVGDRRAILPRGPAASPRAAIRPSAPIHRRGDPRSTARGHRPPPGRRFPGPARRREPPPDASIRRTWPSRRTLACGALIFRRAARAPSARHSWKNPSTEFRTTTPAITAAST